MGAGIPLSGRTRTATGINAGTASILGSEIITNKPVINPGGTYLTGAKYPQIDTTEPPLSGRDRIFYNFPASKWFQYVAKAAGAAMNNFYTNHIVGVPLQNNDIGDVSDRQPVQNAPAELSSRQLDRSYRNMAVRVVGATAPQNNNALAGDYKPSPNG